MYEFCYDPLNPKYVEKAKLSYVDTDSLIVYIKIKNIYVDVAKDVETRFDTSKYELKRTLSKERSN